MHSIRRIAPLLALASVLATLPLATAVAKKPVNHAKLGYYVDNTPIAATINVRPNRQGKLVIKTFQIQCMNADSGMGAGTINLKSIAIGAAGGFKVDGNIKVLGFDTSFKTKLKIVGTFKSGKLTGSVTPKDADSPCAKATYSAKFYGDVQG